MNEIAAWLLLAMVPLALLCRFRREARVLSELQERRYAEQERFDRRAW